MSTTLAAEINCLHNQKERMLSIMSTIQNKVVVIMGASSGIGEAAAKKLAQEGAKLVIDQDCFNTFK